MQLLISCWIEVLNMVSYALPGEENHFIQNTLTCEMDLWKIGVTVKSYGKGKNKLDRELPD